MSLRKQITDDLEFTMEGLGDYGLPVELIDPDGNSQTLKKNSQDKLTGQVVRNTFVWNPSTGEDMITRDPVVTLRLDSLNRIPQNGETWSVKIPSRPDPDAPLENFILSPTKAMKFNESIGYVRIYLQRIEQSA